jgi:hypothetical protein
MSQDDKASRRKSPVGFNLPLSSGSSNPSKNNDTTPTSSTPSEEETSAEDHFVSHQIENERKVVRPKLETRHGSKQIRSRGVAIWVILGSLLLIFGLVLFSLWLIIAGVSLCGLSFAIIRTKKTEERLSADFRQKTGQA